MASHPVQVQQGVLWLWGRGGSEEFVHSAAKTLPIAPEADDPAWFALCAPTTYCPVCGGRTVQLCCLALIGSGCGC